MIKYYFSGVSVPDEIIFSLSNAFTKLVLNCGT